MKFSDALEPFMSYSAAERLTAASTRAKYRDCFRAWLLPQFGSLELEQLSRVHILNFRQDMVNRELSIARQYSVLMCLKTFLKFARSVLGVSCLDPADIKLPNRGKPKVEYLDNEEIQKVLNAINVETFTGMRLRALVELLLATGMRISEALALTREPFEAGKSELTIVGKGKRQRQVFFSPRCLFWIREYLSKRLDDHPALFVTTGYPPRPFKLDDVSRFFIHLKAQAGITKKFTPHILRHTFCTNLLFNGADITHIKDLAGHQDIQTTARYYLGKDNRVLQKVVEQHLDYGLPQDPSSELVRRPPMLHELRPTPPPRQPDAQREAAAQQT